MLAEAIAVVAAAAGVLAIGKKVRVTAEWVTLRPYILPQVGVLMGGKRSSIGRDSTSIKLYGY